MATSTITDGALVHDHGDGHVHSHVPEGDVSMGSLIALGASGGWCRVLRRWCCC